MKKIISLVLTALLLLSMMNIASFSAFAVVNQNVIEKLIFANTPSFTYGDVNQDGKVNINDATAIQRYIAKIVDFSEEQLFAADFDGSTYISVNDCTALQKHLVEMDVDVQRNKIPAISGKIPQDTGTAIDFNVDKNYNDRDTEYKYMGGDDFTAVVSSYEEYAQLVKTPYPEYDEEFFKENSLIFLYRNTTSGSYRYTVDSVSVKDNTIYMRYTYHFSRGWITADMGNWNIYVSVKKSDIANADKLYFFGKTKSAYDPTLNNCQLIVNGKGITYDTYVEMTSTTVFIPLLAVSRELGAEVQWQNSEIATITFEDATYILNTDDISLTEEGDVHKKNQIGGPDGSLRKCIILNDDIALDQATIRGFLSNRDAMLTIDDQARIITITSA